MQTLPPIVRTPKTLTTTIAAGGYYHWDVQGHVFRIMSLSGVSTLQVGFDGDKEQTMYPAVGYPTGPGLQFQRVTIHNSGAGTATIVATVSDEALSADSTVFATLLATTNSLLTAIQTLLELSDTATAIAPTTIAQTGVGETQVVTASANNREVLLLAPDTNAGYVYWSFATGITAANAPGFLAPGDSVPIQTATDIYMCSENGSEEIQGHVLSIA